MSMLYIVVLYIFVVCYTIYMIVLTYFLYISDNISLCVLEIRIIELQFRYAVTPCVSVSPRSLILTNTQ